MIIKVKNNFNVNDYYEYHFTNKLSHVTDSHGSAGAGVGGGASFKDSRNHKHHKQFTPKTMDASKPGTV